MVSAVGEGRARLNPSFLFLPLPCSKCPSCLSALLGLSLFWADHWPGQQVLGGGKNSWEGSVDHLPPNQHTHRTLTTADRVGVLPSPINLPSRHRTELETCHHHLACPRTPCPLDRLFLALTGPLGIYYVVCHVVYRSFRARPAHSLSRSEPREACVWITSKTARGSARCDTTGYDATPCHAMRLIFTAPLPPAATVGQAGHLTRVTGKRTLSTTVPSIAILQPLHTT